MSAAVTTRQNEVLAFIASFIATHGYAPTLREIGSGLSIRSTNGVYDHLRALQRKGRLRLAGDAKSRGIVLTDAPSVASEQTRAMIDDLHAQLAKLRVENATLLTEVTILRRRAFRRRQLSRPQRQLLDAIIAHQTMHAGESPTRAELAERLGRCENAIQHRLHSLEAKGWIELHRGQRRGIVVLRRSEAA